MSTPPPILASTSPIRRSLLTGAGVTPEVIPPRVDEETLLAGLEAEGATPRDIADTLAETKSARVAARHPHRFVIGADQVLDLDGTPLSKPRDMAEAADRLRALRGRTHRLHTAVVVHEGPRPVWRHLETATLTMRDFSDALLAEHLARAGAAALETPGAYRVEDFGIRLFARIEGDHCAILGLPLLPLLNYLSLRGVIAS